jgi:hypothetical protein
LTYLVAHPAPHREEIVMTATTTRKPSRHDCGGPAFGRLTAGCPRCDELAAGAPPVVQAWRGRRARDEDARREEMRAHFAPGSPHSRGACGPVCTAFDA